MIMDMAMTMTVMETMDMAKVNLMARSDPDAVSLHGVRL